MKHTWYDKELPASLLLLSSDLRVLDSNHRARTEFSLSDEPVPLESLCHAEDWSRFRTAYAENCGGEFKVKCRLLSDSHPVGGWYDLRCSRNESDKTILCLAFGIHEELRSGQTISPDKAEALVLMERAQLARNRFLDIMSHELRTPLTAVLGLSEALESGLYGDCSEDQKEAVRIINDCGNSLLRLINDILDVTKLETGKMEVQKEPVEVEEVCQSAIRLNSKAAREQGVTLVSESEATDYRFLGDRQRIKQALSHLLENGIKFSEPGGVVTLKVSKESGTLCFEVSDQGPGISPDQLPSLLESFAQSDQTLARPYNGAGLGLTLAKKLVDLMGGRLTARNQEQGGACFSISMPVVFLKEEADQDMVGIQGEGTVLLVDDHEATVKLLSDALASWGFTVEVFRDAASLQSRSSEEPVRAVLMDGKLPDGSGIDCIRWLRGQEKYKDLPIVFLTASKGLEIKRAGMAAGASAFLEKPVKLTSIAHCLQYLL